MAPALFTRSPVPSKWPKTIAPFNDVQERIWEDWRRVHLERLPTEHGRIVRFNHEYVMRSARAGRTLEIGAGLGEHLHYEDLTAQEYHAVELREPIAQAIRQGFPSAVTVVADCQRRLPYDDASFDRAIAIHVLEHLPDLPSALEEVARLLKPDGACAVVIPCEGGLVYRMGRRVTSQREFESRYKTGYRWFIENEHVNQAHEILHELRKRFALTDVTYFPSRIPLIDVNALIGVTCVRRDRAREPALTLT